MITKQERSDLAKVKRAIDMFAAQMKAKLTECVQQGQCGKLRDLSDDDMINAIGGASDALLFELFIGNEWRRRTLRSIKKSFMQEWQRSCEDARVQTYRMK